MTGTLCKQQGLQGWGRVCRGPGRLGETTEQGGTVAREGLVPRVYGSWLTRAWGSCLLGDSPPLSRAPLHPILRHVWGTSHDAGAPEPE